MPCGSESADQVSVPPTPPWAARKTLIGVATATTGNVAVVMVRILVGASV
jgi:hypothetical protein